MNLLPLGITFLKRYYENSHEVKEEKNEGIK